jgi:hypothetical protein
MHSLFSFPNPRLSSKVPAGNGASPEDSTRGCTDVLCLVFFIIFWAGMIGVGTVGFVYGDTNK